MYPFRHGYTQQVSCHGHRQLIMCNVNELYMFRKLFTKLQYLCTFASSSGASTSSSTQNGAGFNLKIANTNANAVNAFSPPESNARELFFLPGGLAMSLTPDCQSSSRLKLASPPLKTFEIDFVTLD